jgi:hypothetical protein
MPPPRKLVAYLVAAIAGFAVLTSIFRERFVEVILLVVFGCLLASGLIEGELSYGRGSAKKYYRRSESPVVYWCIVAFWCVLIAAVGSFLV